MATILPDNLFPDVRNPDGACAVNDRCVIRTRGGLAALGHHRGSPVGRSRLAPPRRRLIHQPQSEYGIKAFTNLVTATTDDVRLVCDSPFVKIGCSVGLRKHSRLKYTQVQRCEARCLYQSIFSAQQYHPIHGTCTMTGDQGEA